MTHRQGFRRRPARLGVSAVCLAAVLSGCAVKRDVYDVPEVPLPDAYRNEVPAATPGPQVAPPASPRPVAQLLPEWWTLLGSAELNTLVARALENNQDLTAAVARLAQARATFGTAWADQFPELSADARAQTSGPSGGVGTVPPGGQWDTERLYQLGARLTWMPDLWGDKLAASEAAINRLLGSAHGRDAVRADVIAEVVRTYLQYLSFSDRVRVGHEVERVLSGMLDAVEARARDGDATELDVVQQRAAVRATAATVPVLEMQREQARNRLAVLLGTTPARLDIKGETLHTLRFPLIEPGVPTALMWRRPDVRQAEVEMIAADADIDVARALVLPNLELAGEIGYGSNYLNTLFRPESLVMSAVASLTQSIFDFGRREYRADFARARHRELVAQYVRSILRGVQETEDALTAVHHLGRRQELLEDAVRNSRLAYSYSRESYVAGVVDYITLLDTERSLFRNEDDWETVRFDRFAALVDLFRALGGGAPTIDPPEAPEALKSQDLDSLERRRLNAEAGAPELVGFVPPSDLPSAAPAEAAAPIEPTMPPGDAAGEGGWAVLLGGAGTREALEARIERLSEDHAEVLARHGATVQVVDDGDYFRLRAIAPGGINAASALCAELAVGPDTDLRCEVVPR
ncbi:efflux transporter outer membrane subunit [Novispirillum sp. DQ9]|uniref:efflux transporter outer membrane subunit n=1 Tax=Novispirillum sp. DQ9 TaxID=3398612 RepID=UPI003C7A1334